MKCFAWENLKTEKIQIYEINLETWGQKIDVFVLQFSANLDHIGNPAYDAWTDLTWLEGLILSVQVLN